MKKTALPGMVMVGMALVTALVLGVALAPSDTQAGSSIKARPDFIADGDEYPTPTPELLDEGVFDCDGGLCFQP